MNKLIIIIIIVIVIIIITVTAAVVYKYIKDVGNIGNILSDYFYMKYTTGNDRDFTKNDKDIKEFIEKIKNNSENNRPPELLKPFSDSPYSDKWLENENTGFSEFWVKSRPYIRATYDKVFSNKNVEFPVIHFRCSDIPFNKMSMYHIPKVSIIMKVIDIIKSRNFYDVYWLNCNKHLSIGNNCNDFTNFYINIFKENGINVITRCGSILGDFELMVYSPLLVSLNPSSYSFMAGISKNPSEYVSCNMGIEKNGNYTFQKNTDYNILNYEPLLHKDVKNYYDTNEVLSKLKISN